MDFLSEDALDLLLIPELSVVESVQGSLSEPYIVRLHGPREASCTCKGYEYREYCKHITQVRKKYGLSAIPLLIGARG